MKENNQSFDFFTRFFYLLVIAIVTILIGNPHYGTTDDNILAGFVDGSYTGEREKRLIFIRPFVGMVLNTLQNTFPSLGVYSIFMLLLLIVSFSIFGNSISEKNKNRSYFRATQLAWIILATPTVGWFSLSPTYTSVSILGTSLSLISILINLLFRNQSNFILVIATFSLALSMLVRPEGAIGSIVLSILPISYVIYKNKEINLKKIFITSCIIISIFILDIYLQSSTSNPLWRKYDSWNAMRHQVQHRVAEDHLLDLRVENQWSIPEYHLFMDLSFGDERVFNKDWLTPAFENTKFSRNFEGALKSDKIENFKKIFNLVDNYYGLLLFQVILSLWILTRIKILFSTKFMMIIISWTPVLSATYLMVSTLHTPERSVYPLFILPNIFLLFLSKLFKNEFISNFNLKIWTPLFLLSLLLFTFSPKGLVQEYQYNKNEIESGSKLRKDLESFNSNAIYIGPGNAELYDRQNPYSTPAQMLSPKMITIGNWETFSPYWYKRIELLGFSENSIYESLFRQETYWFSFPVPDTAYMVELFLKENGFPSTNRENVKNFTSGEVVYKFLPK